VREGSAKGKVFEPAIGASYKVEARFSGSSWRHGWFVQWRAMRSKLGSVALVRDMGDSRDGEL